MRGCGAEEAREGRQGARVGLERQAMRPAVRVSFLGGASAIGASCALVEVGDQAVVIDGGVRFRNDRPLPDLAQLEGKKLDAILVTHAHSDHTGALPVLHEAFPTVPFYMTPPTRSLVEILQKDALKIMKLPGEREGDVPLYTERQVEGMLERVLPVHHHAPLVLGDLRVTYLPASHILGASMIHLETPGGNVMFTGDYSVTAQRTVPGLARPTLPVDLVITESTYGNRTHADRKLAEQRLVRTVAEVVDKGGRVLIPAFAIGRAQEVLLVLREALRNGQMPRVPVFVDGMVRAVCGVYPQHEQYLAPQLQKQMRAVGHPFFGSDVVAVADLKHRQQIVAGGACVVVASSGMLSGGPSAYFASEFVAHEQDAIIITGYQDEESPGRALLKLAQQPQGQGPRRMQLNGREVEVRCRFESYSLSAHADRMQMVGLLEALQPRCVGLVHGDIEAKEALARSLGDRDVALCEDGVTLERTFSAARRTAPSAPRLDRERAVALVGPDQGHPLDQNALATAWFGHEPQGAARSQFFATLLSLGVVRNDPERPGELRSCQEISQDEREQALEHQLRKENPKGKLLEWCMRQRVDSPQLHERSEGEGFAAELSMTVGGAEVRSGWHRAGSKKLAEQLAARAFLALLEQNAEQLTLREVSEPELSQRKVRNPKGKLLELCAKYHIALVTFEQRARAGGHVRRGLLRLPGGRRCHSAWYLAPTARDAEHAACEELLETLWSWKNNTLPPLSSEDSAALGASPAARPTSPLAAGGLHPKTALNTLQQTKQIDAFGFELISHHGSAHAPRFSVRGWFERAGERTQGSTHEGPSKKDAETLAAAALLEILTRP